MTKRDYHSLLYISHRTLTSEVDFEKRRGRSPSLLLDSYRVHFPYEIWK